MSRPNGSVTFLSDDRAVAPVIGAVLLFGIAILAFSSYQAYVVPDQNSETEFEHFEAVQDDLLDVRNGILEADETGTAQFESVGLGTDYRNRVAAVNPPPTRGSLRTSEPYNVTVTATDEEETVDVTDEVSPEGTDVVPTRLLEYDPTYNEQPIDVLRIEHSVFYLDQRGVAGDVVVYEDESIVRGNNVSIVALQNEIDRSGTQRAAVEFQSGDRSTITADDLEVDELTVTLPTRLEADHWEEQLGDRIEWNYTEGGYDAEGVNALNLTVAEGQWLTIGAVGVDGSPTDWPGVDEEENGALPEEEIEEFDVLVPDLPADDDEHEFVVKTEEGIDFDDDIEIRLGQVDGVDYAPATFTVDNVDEVNYDPDTEIATVENEGGFVGTFTVTADGVDVTGDPDEEFDVDFVYDGGSLSTDFEILHAPSEVYTDQDDVDGNEIDSDGSVKIEDDTDIDVNNLDAEGDIVIGENAQLDANNLEGEENDDIQASGDLVLQDGASINTNNVEVEGDIIMGEDASIDANNVEAGGSIIMDEWASIDANDVEADETIDMGPDSSIDANDVDAEQLVCSEGAEINGEDCSEYEL